jgi:hypothetical protein
MARKRTEITIYQKAKICAIMKSKKMSLNDLSQIVRRELNCDLGISTLSEILKNKEKWENCEISNTFTRQSSKIHSLLEKSLIEWISRMDAINGYVTDEIIIRKAKEFGQKLNICDLQFSNGWLYRFKNRFNLKLKVLHGEANSMNDVDVSAHREKMVKRLAEIDPEVILNMDETGLFFQAFPTKTISSSERKGIKQSKVRITVALCSNASGSIKITPFVIGHSKNPRCFKGFNVTKYCWYYANSKAWMTTDLFNCFMQHLDDELRKYEKKFYLLLDNAPSHNLKKSFKNIEVIKLPKNSTAHLQPMDAGIIKNLKHYYRKKLVVDYMNSIDQAKDFIVNLKTAIIILHEAWEDVKEETIKKCFQKVDIIPGLRGSYAEENLSSDPILKTYVNEFNQIMCEEDIIQTEGIIADDDIIRLCQEEYAVENVILGAEDGKVDDSYNIHPRNLFHAIEIIIKASSSSDSFTQKISNDTVKNLKEVKDDLRKFIQKKTLQTTLDDFLNK